MADEIKVFIRTEQLADHNGHLSCIATKMLHIFAAAGHHQYTKDTWLEPIKGLETFVCLQGHIRTFTCQCEGMLSFAPAMNVRYVV